MTAPDGAYKETMLVWPWISKNPRDWDKLHYAEKVAHWAERVQPIKDFDPAKLPRITQAELKLLGALQGLNGIKDSEAHKAAIQHAEDLEKPIRSFVIDHAKDKAIEKSIEFVFGETVAKIYGWVGMITPVPIADDEMLLRDSLREKLADQFAKYLEQRLRHTARTQTVGPWLQ